MEEQNLTRSVRHPETQCQSGRPGNQPSGIACVQVKGALQVQQHHAVI